jgi:hypothetical protein
LPVVSKIFLPLISVSIHPEAPSPVKGEGIIDFPDKNLLLNASFMAEGALETHHSPLATDY